jgi:hypothetical protein
MNRSSYFGWESSRFLAADQKSVNLQYNTLGRWVDGPNNSATKRLMFQVLFSIRNFLQNSLQKSLFIFS